LGIARTGQEDVVNRGRPETAGLVAALGGILLLVSLFLDWYTLATFTVTAWTAFEVWDLVLAAIAIAVVVSAATHLGYWRGPTHSIGLLVLGLAALVIVASQLINPPPSVLHGGIGDGGWLALVAAVVMTAGAAMAESRVTLSFNAGGPGRPGPRRPADVPLAGPGAVPRGPAPIPRSGPDVAGGRAPAARPYEDDPGYR
jgi:hypothetical protein